MKELVIIAMLICCAGSGVAQNQLFKDRVSHVKALRQSFETTYWRRFWESDEWYIRCIFADVDVDGTEELITSTASDIDRMGDYWKLWKVTQDGKFRQVYLSGKIFFSCSSTCFYKMTYYSNTNVVIGLGMNANVEEECGNGLRRVVKPTPDCWLSLISNDKFALREISPDMESVFSNCDVSKVERLYPEWYFGFDFRPPAPDPHSPYTTWLGYQRPKGDLRPGGGVVKPDCFDVLASRHRSSIKARKGITSTVDVLAVFLDADNDGKTDCYVSSSAEEADAGKFVWTLHVNRDGVLTPAKDAVYPVAEKKELCALPATAKLGKDGFCRVVRFDVNPIFVLLDGSGSPTKVRDSITDIMAHRIEKLECVSFPEEPTAGRQD